MHRECGPGVGGTSYEAVLQAHTRILAADVMQVIATKLSQTEQLLEQQVGRGTESARESEAAG